MNWLILYETAFINFLKREFSPSTERWHSTIRVLAATVIAMTVTQFFHLSQGYWAVITIMVVCAPNVDSSVLKMIKRMFGTFAGVAVGYIIICVFFQQNWFFVASLFALLLVAGLVIARSEQPYVGWVFALSILVVSMQTDASFSEIAGISFERFWVVALGVFASWAALLLVYPPRPIKSFRILYIQTTDHEIERVQWVKRNLHEIEEGQLHASIETLPPKRVDPMIEKKMLVLIGSAANGNRAMGLLVGSLTDRITLVNAISTITSNAITLIKDSNQQGAAPALMAASLVLFDRIETILQQLKAWGESTQDLGVSLTLHPINFQPLLDSIHAFDALHEAEILRIGIREGVGRSPKGNQALMATIAMTRALSTTYSIEHTQTGATHIQVDVLRSITTPLLSPGLSDDASRSFWFAVKLACACVIGYIFVSATKFGSLSTMMVTPLMVVGATGGSSDATRARASLRLWGTILGAIASIFAILFLIPTADSIPGLLLIWIGCSAPLIWILTGGPKVSYMGVQAVFCLAIAIGTTFQPSIDLSPPSGRILGVGLGTFVTLAIFNYFSPDYARNEVMRLFARSLDRIGTLAITGFDSNPGTFSEIAAMRYKIISLILRSRELCENLHPEIHASEPSITREEVLQITENLTLILYSANALALNRISAGIRPKIISSELDELHACAQSIQKVCDIGSATMATQNYKSFSDATKQLETQAQQLEDLIPEIRLRPNIRLLSAEPVQFIIGQIGMYRVAALRLRNLSEVLERITEKNNARASLQQGSPVRFAPSSTA